MEESAVVCRILNKISTLRTEEEEERKRNKKMKISLSEHLGGRFWRQ